MYQVTWSKLQFAKCIENTTNPSSGLLSEGIRKYRAFPDLWFCDKYSTQPKELDWLCAEIETKLEGIER